MDFGAYHPDEESGRRPTARRLLPLLVASAVGCAEPRGSSQSATEASTATASRDADSTGAPEAGSAPPGSDTSASGDSAGTGGHGQTGGTKELPRHYHYVRDERFTRLVIEVDYVAGREPSEAVQEAIATGLESILDKPDGVEIVLDDVLVPGGDGHAWTLDELHALALDRFDLDVDERTIKMHALFVDGYYASDDDDDGGTTFGVAWNHRNHVLFQDVIDSSCAVPLLQSQLAICEATVHNVWVHEIGHVIGLVDAGLPMVESHRDPDHGVHDVDPDCVMYWSVDTVSLVDDLVERQLAGENLHLGFDELCLADIEYAKVVDP